MSNTEHIRILLFYTACIESLAGRQVDEIENKKYSEEIHVVNSIIELNTRNG